jgi:hypothetical protein
MPGTFARTVNALRVTLQPDSCFVNVTSARTSTRSAGKPALARPFEKAIE